MKTCRDKYIYKNIYFLFQFPSLCSQYFKLITFLAEINPEKFASIPHELFKNLMASIELGLNAYPFNFGLSFHLQLYFVLSRWAGSAEP